MYFYLYEFFSSDVITKEEAVQILKDMVPNKNQREEEMKTIGFPAYTTQPGWEYFLFVM